MSDLTITHIGGPTVLIEVNGWRLLTDPTFDPPGRRYHFGWGALSRKLTGPAVAAGDLGPIDAVLLTHDHHGDNLDSTGRALLSQVPTIVTTRPAAKRLETHPHPGVDIRGLPAWGATTLQANGRVSIEVTATPARHGPPASRPIVGPVIGFALRWDGQERGVVWISGDTVLFDGVREVARRFDVGTAVLHLGGVRFPISGPLRYTMTAEQAVRLCGLMNPDNVIPVHYEGWQHFRQGRDRAEQVFSASPQADRVRWLRHGTPTRLTV